MISFLIFVVAVAVLVAIAFAILRIVPLPSPVGDVAYYIILGFALIAILVRAAPFLESALR